MQDDEDQSDARPALRLWHYGQTGLPVTWQVLKTPKGHEVLRTIDIEVHPPGSIGPQSWRAPVPTATFKTIMTELERISVSPAASSEMVLDAGSFGVEIDRYPQPVVLAWTGNAPIGWESLEAWHGRTLHRLEALLPRMGRGGYGGWAGLLYVRVEGGVRAGRVGRG